MNWSSQENAWICTICQVKSQTKMDRDEHASKCFSQLEHMNKGRDENTLICMFCEKTGFHSKEDIHQHIETRACPKLQEWSGRLSQENSPKDIGKMKWSEEKQYWICSKCIIIRTSEKTCKDHNNKECYLLNSRWKLAWNVFTKSCNFCGQTGFSSKKKIRRHIQMKMCPKLQGQDNFSEQAGVIAPGAVEQDSNNPAESAVESLDKSSEEHGPQKAIRDESRDVGLKMKWSETDKRWFCCICNTRRSSVKTCQSHNSQECYPPFPGWELAWDPQINGCRFCGLSGFKRRYNIQNHFQYRQCPNLPTGFMQALQALGSQHGAMDQKSSTVTGAGLNSLDKDSEGNGPQIADLFQATLQALDSLHGAMDQKSSTVTGAGVNSLDKDSEGNGPQNADLGQARKPNYAKMVWDEELECWSCTICKVRKFNEGAYNHHCAKDCSNLPPEYPSWLLGWHQKRKTCIYCGMTGIQNRKNYLFHLKNQCSNVPVTPFNLDQPTETRAPELGASAASTQQEDVQTVGVGGPGLPGLVPEAAPGCSAALTAGPYAAQGSVPTSYQQFSGSGSLRDLCRGPLDAFSPQTMPFGHTNTSKKHSAGMRSTEDDKGGLDPQRYGAQQVSERYDRVELPLNAHSDHVGRRNHENDSGKTRCFRSERQTSDRRAGYSHHGDRWIDQSAHDAFREAGDGWNAVQTPHDSYWGDDVYYESYRNRSERSQESCHKGGKRKRVSDVDAHFDLCREEGNEQDRQQSYRGRDMDWNSGQECVRENDHDPSWEDDESWYVRESQHGHSSCKRGRWDPYRNRWEQRYDTYWEENSSEMRRQDSRHWDDSNTRRQGHIESYHSREKRQTNKYETVGESSTTRQGYSESCHSREKRLSNKYETVGWSSTSRQGHIESYHSREKRQSNKYETVGWSSTSRQVHIESYHSREKRQSNKYETVGESSTTRQGHNESYHSREKRQLNTYETW